MHTRNDLEKTTDLTEKIIKKKAVLNTVILDDYYRESEIQDITDYVGDNIEIAWKAYELHADLCIENKFPEIILDQLIAQKVLCHSIKFWR